MTKPRDGFHNATVQFPLNVWAELQLRANACGLSVNRYIAARMASECGLVLPPMKRPGPKPPKKGRKP